jgi:2-polyprenyl-6-methoxyphenol hydroxylase-like FAD-dependent oxidoreductase
MERSSGAEFDCDVLVVGAGPVGLVLADELRRYGLSCVIVETKTSPSTYSKAAVVNARTLEIMRNKGLVDTFLEKGRRVFGLNLFAAGQRVGHVSTAATDSPYNFILGFSQRETELLLDSHLQAHGLAVERETTMTSFSDEGDRVRAQLVGKDNRTRSVVARWLVGCDGAHSTTRKALGLGFEGATYEESIVQADVRIRWPMPVPADEGLLFASPNGVFAALPLHADGRYRLIVLLSPEETKANAFENETLTVAHFQRFVAERGQPEAVVSDPAWMATFRFHRRLADHYRVGRVFLAGDASHVYSPVGSQGMNTGIQDAYELAWKLAFATHGPARPSFLDSYEAERRPVAAATLHMTDRATRVAERLLGLRSHVAQDLRNGLAGIATHLGALQARIVNNVGGVADDYRDSKWVDEYRESWSLGASPEQELPGLRGRAAFRRGPGPGERVTDVELSLAVDGKRTLFELLLGTSFHLFLLDGSEATQGGYRRFAELAQQTQRQLGNWIKTHVVVPRDAAPEGIALPGELILDPEHVLHEHFGAASECLYLIRPDGFVAFRSQPADGEHLQRYLTHILGA